MAYSNSVYVQSHTGLSSGEFKCSKQAQPQTATALSGIQPLRGFRPLQRGLGITMIAYFRIRKVLKSLQDFIVSEHFQCKTEDANSCLFRASRLYVCVKVSTDQEKLILEGDPRVLRKYREALLSSGIPLKGQAAALRIESQETVDRVWGGNWFYALFK